MPLIKKYDEFRAINESKEDYNPHLHYLLSTLFVYELSLWINKIRYFGVFMNPNDRLQRLKVYKRGVQVIHKDKIVKYINQMIQKDWSSKLKTKFNKIFDKQISQLSSHSLIFIEEDKQLQSTTITPVICCGITSLLLRTLKNSESDAPSVRFRSRFHFESTYFAWDEEESTCKSLLAAYDPTKKHHFDENFLQRCAQKFTDEFIDFYIKASFKYDLKNNPIFSNTTDLATRQYDMLSNYDVMLSNVNFFKAVIQKLESMNQKLNSLFCEHLLQKGTDVDIPLNLFDTKFIQDVQTDLSMLSKCRTNLPNLYNKIQSSREIDDKWKTDLSADMGDLGF